MTATYDAALAKRQAVRSKTGINPNAEFQAGWEAAMRAVGARTEWAIRVAADELYASSYVQVVATETIARNVIAASSYPDKVQLITRHAFRTEWENAS